MKIAALKFLAFALILFLVNATFAISAATDAEADYVHRAFGKSLATALIFMPLLIATEIPKFEGFFAVLLISNLGRLILGENFSQSLTNISSTALLVGVACLIARRFSKK